MSEDSAHAHDDAKTDAGAKESSAQNDPSTSYIAAAAIGVTDLDASEEFYTSLLGLKRRYEVDVPNYAKERVLYFEDSQGGDVVLMEYHDGKTYNYKNNPVRLVFYVPDVPGTIEMIRKRGFDIISEPHPESTFHDAIIGLGRDPDGYMLEFIEDKSLSKPYLTSAGLGVSDLDKAKSFYIDVLGMSVMGDPIEVKGVWDEWILQYQSGKGSGLVLMHYTDGKDHDYSNLPVKTVHYVANSRTLTSKVAGAGLQVVSQPSTFEVQGSKALVSLSHDHDGYTVELVTPQ
jgi:catechol 2,3-dioxygenase-like lactoylglutathione lyase family enzyme